MLAKHWEHKQQKTEFEHKPSRERLHKNRLENITQSVSRDAQLSRCTSTSSNQTAVASYLRTKRVQDASSVHSLCKNSPPTACWCNHSQNGVHTARTLVNTCELAKNGMHATDCHKLLRCSQFSRVIAWTFPYLSCHSCNYVVFTRLCPRSQALRYTWCAPRKLNVSRHLLYEIFRLFFKQEHRQPVSEFHFNLYFVVSHICIMFCQYE